MSGGHRQGQECNGPFHSWGSSYLDLRRPDGETLERLNGMPEKVKPDWRLEGA